MTFIEWFGFLIAMAVLIISVLRRLAEERAPQDPEKKVKTEEERRRAYREMLEAFGVELEEEKPPPPKPAPAIKRKQKPHRTLSGDFELHSSIEDRRRVSTVNKRNYDTNIAPDLAKGQYGAGLVSNDLRAVVGTSAQRAEAPRIQGLLASLPSKKMLIVANEVIGPPKALKDF